MLCIACFIMLCIACFEDGPKENVPRNSEKEKEVIWSWQSPSSNSNRRSSTEPATSPCGASDTKYIGNWQLPLKPEAQPMGCLKNEECPGRMALLERL